LRTVTRGSDPPLVAGGPGGPRRRRRETVPTLVAIVFAGLAFTALGIMLLAIDDGDRAARTASGTAGSIAAPAVPVASATPATTPAANATPTAPPAPPPATTDPAPVALPSPATTAAALPGPATVATTSTTPATPAPTPAPTPALAGVVTPAQAESFVRGYFDAVDAGDYPRSWSQLTPEFQQGRARSYEYYVGFWDDNDITVDDVELVEADPSRAIVDVVLRWNGSSDAATDRFELRRGPEGRLLIARQETIAR
jgi:hypothetical protein